MAAQSGTDIRAGGAYVSLWTKDELQKGLDAAQARLKSFGTIVAGIGGGFMAAGAGILAPLAAAVNAAVDYGSEIQDASDRTGMAAEELQGLRHAAEQSAAGLEELERGFIFMQRTGAGKGLEDFLRHADAVANSTTPAAAAVERFGKAGVSLLPMLKGGSDGIRKLMEEAQSTGLVMSGDAVSGAETFGDQIAILQKQLRMVVVEIGSSLIPILSGGSGRMMEAGRQVLDFIRHNRDLIVALGGLGVALVAGGAAFTAIGIGIVAVTSILGAILSPIGLVVAGLTVLTGLIVGSSITQTGLQNAMNGIVGFALEMKKAISTAVTFIRNGDLENAWKSVFLTLKIEFLKFRDWLDEQWEKGSKKAANSAQTSVAAGLINAWGHTADFFAEWDEGQLDQEASQKRWDRLRELKKTLREDAAAESRMINEADFTPDAERAARRLELEKELQLLREKAAALTEVNNANALPFSALGLGAIRGGAVRIPRLERVQEAMDFAQQSKGTFSSSAIGQTFNVADKVVSKIQDNTKRTADGIEGLRDDFQKAEGIKFG